MSEAPTTITISQKYSHKNENENEHCKNIIIILCGLSFCVQTAEQHCCNFSGMFRIIIKASFLVWSNFKIGWKQKKTEIFVIQWDTCEQLK